MFEYPIGYETIGCVAMLTNPKVGSGSVRHAAEEAMERFGVLGVEVFTFQGVDLQDTRRLTRQAIEDEYDAIVVCGGDGTVNVALQEVVGTDMPLGIIPAGVGNDHARQFRLPTSPESAADIIYEGFTTTSDVGKLTDSKGESRYFGTVACAGFDAAFGNRVAGLHLPTSKLGYSASVAAEFFNMTPRLYRIEFEGLDEVPYIDEEARATRIARDGQAAGSGDSLVLERRINLAAFGNSRYYAGGMMVCPRADHHDNYLDVTIIEDASRIGVMRSYLGFRKGTHLDYEFCSSYRCRKATIELLDKGPDTLADIDAYADGDPMLSLPVTIESVPAAVRFIVPAP
ncbi:diacylglycerol kinase family protein [Corynebacterium mendelii]|uniref:NAD(+)/NADH kinase n=1 Tax=Corynebacterium mendelii TaxID=2765362 RepID=A0A939IY10_9CORY|nr:diacylglycerol kinase family protein [Corynebacterium mendelii]MBN9644197.1 NAD(+)/NADH kinase [Corynebacterium mendelii]